MAISDTDSEIFFFTAFGNFFDNYFLFSKARTHLKKFK